MKRRQFLKIAAASPLAVYALIGADYMQADSSRDLTAMRERWRELLPEGVDVPSPDDRVEKPDREWQDELSPERYRILFREGTEPAGSSPLNREHRPGVFTCAACGLPLFTSEMKYDSGTGWPSFFTFIPDSLDTKRDFKLIWPRTEYHCIRCGGHQGHVFDDGPEPTGKRYCNNGLALAFLSRNGRG